jgi:uridine kinase
MSVSARQALLQDIARSVLRVPKRDIVRIAIDGVDGAGKTVFADELARALEATGGKVIRASIDGFHNSASIRYRRGRASPEGFFADSYNYEQLRAALLDPLSPGGTRRYRTAVFDHRSDSPISIPEKYADPGSILVFDGIFLHRPELRGYWDFSIFLEVGFHISIPRGAQRGEGSADADAQENRRYVEGQKLYLRDCKPKTVATMTVNNENLAAPHIVI